MKAIILSFSILLGMNFGMATDYPTKQIFQYKLAQHQTVELPTNFAKPFIIDQKDIDLLAGKTIHHIELIYTKYAASSDFDQEGLNYQRLKQLKRLLPQVNSDNPSWTWVEQTGATTRDVANNYFHGFVIHYGDKLGHNELGQFMSNFAAKPNQFNVHYPDGGHFKLASGTSINIDPKAVSYLDGSPVSGYYTLFYTEYRNPAEIALSGLPMAYDDANFSSIGMYQLRAEKNGKELKLIEPMTVDFNCTEIVGDAAFYSMDDESGEWKKHHDIEFDGQVQNQNLTQIDEQRAIWMESGEWSMSMQFQQIDDKTTRATLDENAWWNFEQMTEDERPDAIISVDSLKHTLVIPSDNVEAFQNEIFKARIIKREWPKGKFKMGKRGAQPNNVGATLLGEGSSDAGHTYPTIVKGLNSKNFGVYNCDQVYRIGEAASINPIYKNTETGESINDGHVACVMDLSYNGSFSFHPNHLTLNKEGRNAVLLFTRNKEIYLIDEAAFAQLNLSNAQTIEMPMKNVTDQLKSPNDLKQLLNI